ncbi:hypothetical protein NM688_g576 [Phlebia brevispora]|uniref:Uncharacterized protein n=1 Tax=Phlebia brevispora TaxID=194682 RepID=A0ACC1TE44_9APHY|nr:hypothetical protein NM688_g576 [Phlebia brevispora]
MPNLPTETWEDVASRLRNVEDICSLTRCNRQTLYAGRQVLFKECSLTLGQDGLRLSAFLDFLYYTPDAARAIRTFVLSSESSSADTEAHVDLPTIYNLLRRMPGLERVALYNLHWDGNPHSLFIENHHPRLHSIKLSYITAIDSTESPLELLRLSKGWRSIILSEVMHPRGTMDLMTNYILPYPWPVFASVQILNIWDIIQADLRMTCHLLKFARDELLQLQLRVPDIESLHPLFGWNNLFRAIRKLSALQTFCLSMPLNQDNCAKDKDAKKTVGGHVEFMMCCARNLPRTLKAFRLYVKLEDPLAATWLFKVPWKSLAKYVKALPAFTTFALEIRCSQHGDPVDRNNVIGAIEAAFDFLPYRTGNALWNILLLARSSEDAEMLMMSWKEAMALVNT